jgi:hypothetical protein
MSKILNMEHRLQMAQADDALAEIRRHRCIVTGLYQFKKLNVSGTGNRPNTRMWALFTRFNHKITKHAKKYRALTMIDPNGLWHDRLHPLDTADIRGPGKDVEESHSRYEPSWIWLVPRMKTAPDMEGSEEQLDNSMQVEWAKSKSRRDRWEEEVPLTVEEMSRVIRFHRWKAQWWREKGKWRKKGSSKVLHGVQAYAEKQAALSDQLAQSSAALWYPILAKRGFSPDWAADYVVQPDKEAERSTNNDHD